MKKVLFTNSFILKVLAIVTMTLDHIGFMMISYGIGSYDAAYFLRIIGRIAMPLYAFMAVEGALHSKNIGKYILRLGIIGSAVFLYQLVTEILTLNHISGFTRIWQGNIFIDLILIVLMIYLFNQKKIWMKLLGLIPIVIGVVSLFLYSYELSNNLVYFFPYFLRPQYDLMAILLALLFYLVRKLLNAIYTTAGLNPEYHQETTSYHIYLNLLFALAVGIVGFYQFSLQFVFPKLVYWDTTLQMYMMFAALPLLFYNGRRGYDSKWFRIVSYLYYPVHLILIYLIFSLLSI